MTGQDGSQDALIPARYYARAAELLIGQGVDLAPALALSGISLQRLLDPEAKLALQDIERLLQAVMVATGRRDLALDLGREIQLRNHSVVGYAILSSPSVDYALRLTARYFRLIFPAFSMRYRWGADHALVEFAPAVPMSHATLVFHLETVAVAAHHDIEELLEGELPDYDLYLSIAQPPHHRRYRELGRARVHFAAATRPGIRMMLPAELMSRRPRLADPQTLGLAEQRCRNLLQRVRERGDVGGWVRMMLREAQEGMPSLSELARTLSVSPRTLDRYLKQEGLRFRQLQLEQRHARACSLLRDPGQTVTGIAYELGYSDAANFTRAFRRMSGCSPSVWRKQAMDSPPDGASWVQAPEQLLSPDSLGMGHMT